MQVAFTICSNNYLAHAKTAGDSFLKYHPDFVFFIGLVDTYSENFDYSFFKEFEIIPVEKIGVENFEELNKKYNIVELNTAVKPSYYHYLFQKYEASKIIYIDPDVLVTSRFEEVIEMLDHKNIILTPHICSPIDDIYAPTDYHTLRGGIFNLGFLALSDYKMVYEFLNWWHSRVLKYGFANFSLSMFYDQLWINYVPTFYDNYYILKNKGYNMANWNLHERCLTKDEKGDYFVNSEVALRFFHFSSYRYNKADVICSYLTRYNFSNRSDLVEIFTTYRKLLLENKVEKIAELSVFYYPKVQSPAINKNKNLFKRVKQRLSKTVNFLITGNV